MDNNIGANIYYSMHLPSTYFFRIMRAQPTHLLDKECKDQDVLFLMLQLIIL